LVVLGPELKERMRPLTVRCEDLTSKASKANGERCRSLIMDTLPSIIDKN